MSTLAKGGEGGAADPSFHRLLTCLEQIRHKLDSREDDFLFLSNYFQSQDFRKLFKVHSTVACSDDGALEAVKDHGISGTVKGGETVELAQEVVEALLPNSLVNREVQELQHILTKPHFKGLLQAHDVIATGNFTLETSEEKSEMLFNLNANSERVDTQDILPVRNCEKDEFDNTDDGDDHGVVDDDNSDDNDGDDVVDNDGDDSEDGGGDDDQAQVIDRDEIKQTPTVSAIGNNSPPTYSSLFDNQHAITPKVLVHVTNADMENVSTDPLWWEGESSSDNKESTFQEPVIDHSVDSEMQSAKTADVTSAVSADIKDRYKEIDIKRESKEKVMKDGYKKNDMKDGQKVGVHVVAAADNAVRTVRLFRNAKETLGITVKALRNGENTERIIVARILSGGLVDTFGTLHVNDEILEINGRRVEGMTANEVADMMDGITGSVDIKIVPLRKDRKLTRETKVSLRAFFDYNPLQDPLIPCKEVGVTFSTGDVLHVVNMDDAKWWQARKEGSSHDKAGLIPSKDFQEKRQQFNKISTSSDVSLQKDKNGRRTLPFWRKRKNDSNKVLCNFLQDVRMDGWPAYEPVAKYVETTQKKRLLLLIGAPGVGRNELKKMLLSNSPDKFITTVPHTSRHMKSYETDGKEYFFVSRQTMENFIQKRKFIEFGEYKGCLYGTSKDSIKRALKTGKTCVLKVQPEVMLLLRTAEFKPYCIYVKPPSLKELRTSRLTVQGKAKPASNKSYMRTFKEEDLQEMISASRELEDNYGKFFDLTVINKDTEEAYNSITEATERLEQEGQWVPRDWVQKT